MNIKSKSIRGKMAARLFGVLVAAGMLAVPQTALLAQQRAPQAPGMQAPRAEDGTGWAGIGIEEVTAAKAKELKLPGEYGALVAEVGPDSPAAKAGIKQGDVIVEYNGQRVEGTVELRRLVRETPPGRTANITLWRDGKSQSISLQVASSPDGLSGPMSRVFGFGQAPPDFGSGAGKGPNGPGPRGEGQPPYRFRGGSMMPFDGNGPGSQRVFVVPPALGVSAQDVSGQLGNYFGAPDGEGVLITNVPENSPGGKAGLKAGDVITQVDGERVHNLGELRAHLRDKQREGKSVKLDVVRKGTELSIQVQLDKPPASPDHPGAADRGIPL